MIPKRACVFRRIPCFGLIHKYNDPCIKAKKRRPRRVALRCSAPFILDDVHVHAVYDAVEVGTYHLLTVASHDSLAGHEVFWSEDCGCSLQWDIWRVYVSAFKERRSATTNENHVAEEVRINDNVELLAQ